ncbi:glycolipid sulfotransferase [Mycobacterium angelicum]|uniref:Glycolipid sulfotransferase n=2 Tax=Mycobacterium angelicum TaxID=470074 RepID=A0A1W9ZR57_MYCAN|nr:glycolipid sulfotransferase [Mycobacterium angelicum]
MMTKPLIAPTRVVRDYLSSSLVWDGFLAQGGFVEGDIVIATPVKSGTTWTQRIIQQILRNGAENDGSLSDSSPWLDSSWGDHAEMLDVLNQQREAGIRRVVKSHLPAAALPIAPEARYVFVGRNGKDTGISFHHMIYNYSESTMSKINEIHAQWSGDATPLVISEDMQAFFDLWLETDGYGCCDLFDLVKSWWQLRDEPNVLLLHYQELKEDLAGQIVRLAEFLGIDPGSLRMDVIVEHCSFEYMSGRAEKMAPFNGQHMSSAKAFFHKGPNRDYRSELTAQQVARFDEVAQQKLGAQCARWLETGKLSATG